MICPKCNRKYDEIDYDFCPYCGIELMDEYDLIELKEIIEHPSNDSEWYFKKGYYLSCLKRYGEALECYDKAIERNISNYRAWHNKGVCLEILGRNEEAIECYDKAAELDFLWSIMRICIFHP